MDIECVKYAVGYASVELRKVCTTDINENTINWVAYKSEIYFLTFWSCFGIQRQIAGRADRTSRGGPPLGRPWPSSCFVLTGGQSALWWRFILRGPPQPAVLNWCSTLRTHVTCLLKALFPSKISHIMGYSFRVWIRAQEDFSPQHSCQNVDGIQSHEDGQDYREEKEEMAKDLNI